MCSLQVLYCFTKVHWSVEGQAHPRAQLVRDSDCWSQTIWTTSILCFVGSCQIDFCTVSNFKKSLFARLRLACSVCAIYVHSITSITLSQGEHVYFTP